MGEDQLKELPPIQGYVNLQELRAIALKTLGASSFLNIFLLVVVGMFSEAHKWYIGPGAAIVIPVLTMIASMIQARIVSLKYLKDGEPR